MSQRPPVVVTDPIEPPPPGGELAARIAALRPVAARRPRREVAWIALGGASWAALLIAYFGPRLDLRGLPPAPFALGLVSWVALAAIGLAVAWLPARGQVLPSLAGSRIAVIALPCIAAVAAVLTLADAPGLTRHLEGEAALRGLLHCFAFGVGAAALPIGLVLMAARRRLLVGSAWTGACAGVACGAIGAFVLHGICSIGGALHAVCAHAAALVGAGLVGAVIGSRLAR